MAAAPLGPGDEGYREIALVFHFGVEKVYKRVAELTADPKVPYTDAVDVVWKEVEDHYAAQQAEFRARYKDIEDPYDKYAAEDDEYEDDSEEDEESEAGGGEAGERRRDDEKKKNPRLEEEAPRILLSRL